MSNNPIADIRADLKRFASSAPAAGTAYIQDMNRIRSWMIDMAETMLESYNSVSAFGMNVPSEYVESLIMYARAEAEQEYEQYEPLMTLYRESLEELPKHLDDARHFEQVNDYSVSFATSRSALQAIQTALGDPDDCDIFSLTRRAGHLAEQCILVEAYCRIAAEQNDAVATPRQTQKAVYEASAIKGPHYVETLRQRLSGDYPSISNETSETAKPAL